MCIYIYIIYIYIHTHSIISIWSGSKIFIKPKCVLVLGQYIYTYIYIYIYIYFKSILTLSFLCRWYWENSMPCMRQSSRAGLHIGLIIPHPVTALPCLDSQHPLHHLQFLNPLSSSVPVWPKDVTHHLKDQTERVQLHPCLPIQVKHSYGNS